MQHKVGIKSLCLFELKSWLGRKFIKSQLKLNRNKNYLNLGCAGDYFEGYVNADFFYKFKFWKKYSLTRDWQLDLRYPLDCPDGVFDGIFFEHTLEHLYPDDAQNLLRELHRIMKKGSTLRVTVPDLQKYIEYYNDELKEPEKSEFDTRFESPCVAISSLTQNYFHYSVWDYEHLKISLEMAGFSDVKKSAFGKAQDKKLDLDRRERAWETLYVEAIKK